VLCRFWPRLGDRRAVVLWARACGRVRPRRGWSDGAHTGVVCAGYADRACGRTAVPPQLRPSDL